MPLMISVLPYLKSLSNTIFRKYKEEGQDEKVSAIRKKQRALILKLNQKKSDIER